MNKYNKKVPAFSYQHLQNAPSCIHDGRAWCAVGGSATVRDENKTALCRPASRGRCGTEQLTPSWPPSFNSSAIREYITRHVSLPTLTKRNKRLRIRELLSTCIRVTKQPLRRPYFMKNVRSNCHQSYNLFGGNCQTDVKVYQCQYSADPSEKCGNCCCSCNSDVIFRVMKDLYNCYKRGNCSNCNCILCHLPKQLDPSNFRYIDLEAALREVAMNGFDLPEGKTHSERNLIVKIRKDLGLPPEPETTSMRDKYTIAANARLMCPLEGKSLKQKEKILQNLVNLGIQLPIGRSLSEKKIIAKIKAKSELLKDIVPKVKAAKLLRPSVEETIDQRNKIIRRLAMQGIPLPEGKSVSEKNLIDNIRVQLGLPPNPETPLMWDKHKKASYVGLLHPLEGKTYTQKEKILQGLHDMGIPMPKGRTNSEKALIRKVISRPRSTSVVELSQRIDKTAEQLAACTEEIMKQDKEEILRERAIQGILLPKAKTKHEKKLMSKIRYNLGLPPEPKKQSMKVKHMRAANVGLLLPLDGKSQLEKERILKGLHGMDIPLPEGRTISEKALISEIKGDSPISIKSGRFSLWSQKFKILRKSKKNNKLGLLTPLKRQPSKEKKTITDLPPSENQVTTKHRPKTQIRKKQMQKAYSTGNMASVKYKHTIRNKGKTPSQISMIDKRYGAAREAYRGPSTEQQTAQPMIGSKKPNSICACSQLVSESKRVLSKTVGEPQICTEGPRTSKDFFIIPIVGKSPKEKEKVLRRLEKIALLVQCSCPEDTFLEQEFDGKVSGSNKIEAIPHGKQFSSLPLLPPRLVKRLNKQIQCPAFFLAKKNESQQTATGTKDYSGPSDGCLCSLLTAQSEKEISSKCSQVCWLPEATREGTGVKLPYLSSNPKKMAKKNKKIIASYANVFGIP